MPRKPTVQDYAKMRLRNRHPSEWCERRAAMSRSALGFARMGRYLSRERKALEQERYITAFYGCRTAWSAIEAMSIYFNVADKTSKVA